MNYVSIKVSDKQAPTSITPPTREDFLKLLQFLKFLLNIYITLIVFIYETLLKTVEYISVM
jgi:hypothetical protein